MKQKCLFDTIKPLGYFYCCILTQSHGQTIANVDTYIRGDVIGGPITSFVIVSSLFSHGDF